MLKRLGNGVTIQPRLGGWQPAMRMGRRGMAAKSDMLKATTEAAQKLDATGVWKRSGRAKADAIKAHETRRVNIVSQKLCDDIVKYIGSSLERHRGCDLIDLNPGAGLWSRALHEAVEPRKHVMMDLDAELYRPFLGDLLSRPNVHMIPKSGVLWRDMLEMIKTQLTQQAETPRGEPPRRNDTLLVTANLATFPKKAFMSFDSVSTMVTYQLMSSIRTSSLFQNYGLVRMLLWINDEDKRRLLPKSLQRRKRASFEAELACEWIHEVAGVDVDVTDRLNLRDEWINKESALKTLERMQRANLEMPRGRATKLYSEAEASAGRLMGQALAGTRPPMLSRPFRAEMKELEEELAAATAEDHDYEDDEEQPQASTRLKNLRHRSKKEAQGTQLVAELFAQREAAFQLAMEKSPSSPEFKAADAAWNERVANMKKNYRHEFAVFRDSYHIFRQDPPALLWDRRAYEPLAVRPDEFYPNAPAALLDIQPKTMHPLLLQYGPETSQAGPLSDIMLRSWFSVTLLPAQRAMDGISGGFGDLVGECPSLTDPRRGGSPMTEHGAVTARAINGAQWEEIVQAWMKWPFRPPYHRLLGRMDDEAEAEEDDGGRGKGMPMMS